MIINRQAYLAGQRISHVNPSTSYFGGVLGPFQDNQLGVVNDSDVDTCLKVNNYEDTVRQLDMYYGLGKITIDQFKLMILNFPFWCAVKRQLLNFQSPTTGLFPAQSSDTEIGSVRDSIYSASAIWSLYQAYRLIYC